MSNMAQRRLLVMFGSQTGSAQETAERITREAKLRHFSVSITAMDHYDMVCLHFTLTVPILILL